LTTDYHLFRRHKRESIAVGIGGVAASFAITFIPLYCINTYILHLEPVMGFASALFISAVLSNTAIEICAKLFMTSEGRMKTVVIGASFVDDVVAVFLIGVVSSTVLLDTPPDAYQLSWLTIKVVLFLAGSFFVFYYVIEKVFNSLLTSLVKRERYPLTATIIAGFSLALLARPFGLHEVIGAYIAGLMIGRWGSQVGPMLKRHLVWDNLIKEIDPPLRAIFGPLFFGYVGLVFSRFIIENSTMSPTSVLLAVVLLATALSGKLLGCGGAALTLGFSRKESVAVGAAMGGRGSLELVLLLYGLGAGAITDSQFTAVVLATLGTVVLTPLLYDMALKRMERGEGAERKTTREDENF
ncbi:MAG: cation:proton antiporter, partial [Thermoplasmata archaeon]|nr:cation:proton antiporter [Thermoplasmata archaeon]